VVSLREICIYSDLHTWLLDVLASFLSVAFQRQLLKFFSFRRLQLSLRGLFTLA
jgi:hypothetical protein